MFILSFGFLLKETTYVVVSFDVF